ncbi:MAG: 50S ribosome-binding GTPase [Candidatus Hydrogenedentes bacterium]|nr:50S ribosome-binding GTPase [Candidatus Hydrogenedentota bacterium]
MSEDLGQALAAFDRALQTVRTGVESDPGLYDAIFRDADDWLNLLTYKLLPHMAGEGCLFVAVTGGTNSGKSTVFNLLLASNVSPVLATAAATRHPLLAANLLRCEQCLEGKLVPEFRAQSFAGPEDVLSKNTAAEALYVARVDGLPDRLALMDTPDIDSIDKQNWTVAENIRAAGDVLLAVLTGEKYRDERVVEFFRRAIASGRVVVPLMNKANPEDDYAVARRQLDEFCGDLGLESPRFVIPHDFNLTRQFSQPIASLDGAGTLMEYLLALDAPAVKRRVYRDSVRRFAERAGEFVLQAERVGSALRTVVTEFEAQAQRASLQYDPAPGREMSGLFHEFVQSKRGRLERWVGTVSTAALKGVTAIAKRTTRALLRRVTLQKDDQPITDAEIHAAHIQAIGRITRDLASGYIESSHSRREPVAGLLENRIAGLDTERIVVEVIQDTVRSETISEAFRQHANNTLNEWWNDHKVKRNVLIALDGLLFIAPTAIAIPISVHTGGFGVAETMIVAGTAAEQFLARVVEYQFGDAMFNFLQPWRTEQQQTLEQSLVNRLANPCLSRVREHLELLEGETLTEMRRCLDLCRNA